MCVCVCVCVCVCFVLNFVLNCFLNKHTSASQALTEGHEGKLKVELIAPARSIEHKKGTKLINLHITSCREKGCTPIPQPCTGTPCTGSLLFST